VKAYSSPILPSPAMRNFTGFLKCAANYYFNF
jgi:hypothetical protein